MTEPVVVLYDASALLSAIESLKVTIEIYSSIGIGLICGALLVSTQRWLSR